MTPLALRLVPTRWWRWRAAPMGVPDRRSL
jgi:hypothetical protein